jgi:hypothetical protein
MLLRYISIKPATSFCSALFQLGSFSTTTVINYFFEYAESSEEPL